MIISILWKIYNTLDQVEIHGHKNHARMNAAMDALRDIINIIEEGKKEEEAHENLDKQRTDV